MLGMSSLRAASGVWANAALGSHPTSPHLIVLRLCHTGSLVARYPVAQAEQPSPYAQVRRSTQRHSG
jgi:hypothetical protein